MSESHDRGGSHSVAPRRETLRAPIRPHPDHPHPHPTPTNPSPCRQDGWGCAGADIEPPSLAHLLRIVKVCTGSERPEDGFDRPLLLALDGALGNGRRLPIVGDAVVVGRHDDRGGHSARRLVLIRHRARMVVGHVHHNLAERLQKPPRDAHFLRGDTPRRLLFRTRLVVRVFRVVGIIVAVIAFHHGFVSVSDEGWGFGIREDASGAHLHHRRRAGSDHGVGATPDMFKLVHVLDETRALRVFLASFKSDSSALSDSLLDVDRTLHLSSHSP